LGEASDGGEFNSPNPSDGVERVMMDMLMKQPNACIGETVHRLLKMDMHKSEIREMLLMQHMLLEMEMHESEIREINGDMEYRGTETIDCKAMYPLVLTLGVEGYAPRGLIY
jgi:hypothetical protein